MGILPSLLGQGAEDLKKWDRPVPRYTSYPTAPQFIALGEEVARERLQAFDATERPLSLYVHIPFCKTMCLFCGCSVVLNRRPERQASYVEALLREIEGTAKCFSKKREVSQLHLGGGTPTSLTEEELARLMETLHRCFSFSEKAEISIEIDPRTVLADKGKKLETLRQLGFNRVSFGVQDLDPRVQEAVKRRQSAEMTFQTYAKAKELGFVGINIDLIYGLPLQTPASFRETAKALMELKPDRIAFFSYAKIPWIKEHQKAIREEDLPSTEEKFQIYVEAREIFLEAGYTAIGMDHFARKEDELTLAYQEGRLTRNFQGYSVQKADDMLGIGITSIGYLSGAYLQNVKTLEEYHERIEKGMLPIFRGCVLSEEDHRRRWVIQELMCRFRIDKEAFEKTFGLSFDLHFAKEKTLLDPLLAEEDCGEVRATPLGRLFIRLLAACFDQYLASGTYSRAV
ncbi:MAG: oxygen-independent coproporphyrinogen III oxidase [Verrucomicrobiota bacterium]|nr:oxygen-independent coproporphyrinogen III oxidase [Verrucomicrobiota bacterium]